jgi:hypothetical protein
VGLDVAHERLQVLEVRVADVPLARKDRDLATMF